MKYKLALLVFITGIITIFLSGILPRILDDNNVDEMLNYRKYYSIVGYLFGLIYIFILFKYSRSNWIKALAVIGVFSSALVIPYSFLYFRTYSGSNINNLFEFAQFVMLAMFAFAVINLIIATILLFLHDVRLSVRILLFITMLSGVISTPFLSQVIFQYLVRGYDFSVVAFYFQFTSIIGLIVFFARVYITFAIVEDSEKTNLKESDKVIAENAFDY